MSPRALVQALLLLALGAAAPAVASELTQGVRAYEYGDYGEARRALEAALSSGLLSADERARARLYLGSALLAAGDEPLARRTLEALFDEAPEASVDAALFPPRYVALAEEVRASRAPAPGPGSDTPRRDTAAEAALTRPLPVETARAPPPLALAFVPFGAGQFANERPVKGAVFLGLEALAFGTAAYALARHESLKAPGSPGLFACSDEAPCRFRPEDVSRARTLQKTYVVAFWLGIGTAAAGVVDALLERE